MSKTSDRENIGPAKWIRVERLVEILQKIDPEFGVEPNANNSLLVSDEHGYTGYIEISNGHGSYHSFDGTVEDEEE